MAKRKVDPWKLWNIPTMERSISAVFKNNDIGELNSHTYGFIIRHMGFIAHYDLSGFRAAYGEDIDEFRRFLQSSESSADPNHNLEWAKKYESNPIYAESSTPEYVKNVAEGIRAIIHVARTAGYQPPLLSALDVAVNQTKNRRAIP